MELILILQIVNLAVMISASVIGLLIVVHRGDDNQR